MPKYEVTAPDGKVYEVNAPEGATEQQAIEYVQKSIYKAPVEVPPMDFSPTNGMSETDKFLAGMGKGASDLMQGAGQFMGLVSDKEVADTRKYDKALMDTTSGAIGNVVGTSAAIAPAILIPGANTYAGAAAIGGLSGALQPVAEGESRAVNAGTGMAGGVIGQGVGNLISSKLASNAAQAASSKMANATRDATLKASKEAGYQVPRSLYDPTFLSNRLESLAGKAATKQQAAVNNQQVTNKLAREYLGLAPDTPLDKATMETLRDTYGQAYRDASAIPALQNPFSGLGVNSVSKKSGAQLVDEIKEARDVSRAAWKSFNSGQAQKPTKMYKEAKKADRLVTKLENELDQLAQQSGFPDVVTNLRAARENIAKVHTIENALNDATGDVSARTVFAQGKKLNLTGQAKKIADFAKAFSQVAQDGTKTPAAGVSKVEMGLASILGGLGTAGFGMPGIATAALPFMSHMVRPLAVNGGVPVYSSLARDSAQRLLPYSGLLGAGLATQY